MPRIGTPKPSRFASKLNAYKSEFAVKPAEPPKFQPLRSWPFVPHPEQARIDEFLRPPSWKPTIVCVDPAHGEDMCCETEWRNVDGELQLISVTQKPGAGQA